MQKIYHLVHVINRTDCTVSPSFSPQHQMDEAALRHCLRAFLVLGRGDEAEKQAARLVMLPFVDLNFTQVRCCGGKTDVRACRKK